MRLKQYLWVLLCIEMWHLDAQVLTIKDHVTGKGIPYVAVICMAENYLEESNENGQVQLDKFLSCDSFLLRYLGYEDLRLSMADIQSKQYKLEMEPAAFAIDHIVISSSRWSQRSREVPAKVSAISKSSLSLINPQSAADMLAISGEVFIQKSQQGGGSPMIRGFSTNRLLYAVDGVRMNTAIFRSGNLQNVISLDPFAIENTEVIFGPGSVLYGSDAIGGVMTFQTLTPSFSGSQKMKVVGNGTLRYSSANSEKTGHVDLNLGWQKFAMVSSFSTNNYGDLRMGSHGPEEYLRNVYSVFEQGKDTILQNADPEIQRPTAFKQYNLMQKIRFAPNDNLDFTYAFHYSATSEYSRYDRLIRYRNALPRYGEWNYGPQKWMMNNLSMSLKQDQGLFDQLMVRLALQSFEESRISRDIFKTNRLIQTEKVKALSVNLDFSKETGKKNDLFYGLEFVSDDVDSQGEEEDIVTYVRSPAASRYPAATWSSYAVYVNDQYRIGEKFMLQGGLRYNLYALKAKFDNTFFPFPYREANNSDGALTGSLGLVWRPLPSLVISSNISSGFRAPNVDDLGKVFDSTPGSVTVPNPDLRAENARNVEVDVAKSFGGFLKADVAAYYTVLNDAMVRRSFNFNGEDSIFYAGELSRVEAVQNAAKATVYGIQAGLEIKLARGLSAMGKYNYQIGEEELDDGSTSPSRHAPPSFGYANLSYRRSGLNVVAYIEFSGKKEFEELPQEEQDKAYLYAIDKDGKPFAPSWHTYNLKGSYLLGAHLICSAGIENITDLRYKTYSSGLVAPGRNLVISLRATF
ncbi:MAG: TonB-dependent receptor [Saprospiraceae bacterium]|nr:TonB-dependent receptor [Saprospiraceae bacterium]